MPADFDLIRIASGKNRSSLRWAEFAHRGVQRKNAPFGYITHVATVSQLMAAAGGNRNHVVACDLHDVVEDTVHLPEVPFGTVGPDGLWVPRRFTPEDIEEHFGIHVEAYVRAVTKNDYINSLPKGTRAEPIFECLMAVGDDPRIEDPRGGVKVKSCDLTVNLGDVVLDSEAEGPQHLADVFGIEKAEPKLRDYLQLSGLLQQELHAAQWDRLADALNFRTKEAQTVLDNFLWAREAGTLV
jgi:hypothetical protein